MSYLFVYLSPQNFDSDISSVGIDGCWQADSQRLLNEVMVEHFFRQGMLDVAEELCQVTVCQLREDEKEPPSSFSLLTILRFLIF